MELKKENRTGLVKTDVLCDVCANLITTEGVSVGHGVLSAKWGYGSKHDGERYEVHLCEICFFNTLANLRRDHMTNHLFDEPADTFITFGLVKQDSYFKD